MTVIASRTPEGDPLRCPLCGELADVEFSSFPVADANCPHCNALLLAERDKLNKTSIIEQVTPRPQERAPAKSREPEFASSPCSMADFWRVMGWADHAQPSLQLREMKDAAAILAVEREIS